MKNIVLIGFMGTGKTTIAIKLSQRLNMKYVSIDGLIEAMEKRTINEIFTKSGEEYFRDIESRVIRDISAMDGQVIDTGGGVVLIEENIDSLKSNGIIICLTACIDTIMERTKRYKHRPLLNVEDPKRKVTELMAKRAPLYARADYMISTDDNTVCQVVEKIVSIAGEIR